MERQVYEPLFKKYTTTLCTQIQSHRTYGVEAGVLNNLRISPTLHEQEALRRQKELLKEVMSPYMNKIQALENRIASLEARLAPMQIDKIIQSQVCPETSVAPKTVYDFLKERDTMQVNGIVSRSDVKYITRN